MVDADQVVARGVAAEVARSEYTMTVQVCDEGLSLLTRINSSIKICSFGSRDYRQHGGGGGGGGGGGYGGKKHYSIKYSLMLLVLLIYIIDLPFTCF